MRASPTCGLLALLGILATPRVTPAAPSASTMPRADATVVRCVAHPRDGSPARREASVRPHPAAIVHLPPFAGVAVEGCLVTAPPPTGGDSIWNGVAIGAGAGAGLGAVLLSGACYDASHSCWPIGAAIGGGIGALVGALIDAR